MQNNRPKSSKRPSVESLRLRAIFARNIRLWADVRGMSLNHLADQSGVSRAQMYNVLAGTSSPSLDWINKVAPVLDIQVWELLVIDESQSSSETSSTAISTEADRSQELLQSWCL